MIFTLKHSLKQAPLLLTCNRQLVAMSNKRIVNTKEAPGAIGPYNQAIEANGTLYLSGCIGVDVGTGKVANGYQGQMRQCLRNMTHILTAGGYQISDVVKCTVFITDINQYSAVNEIYEQFFTETKPARSLVEVSALPKGCNVEIEGIAVKSAQKL